MADLIKTLDDDQPDTRDKASAELLSLAHRFEPMLTVTYKTTPAGEVLNWLTTILATVRDDLAPADLLFDLRAVEVLDAIGTADAKALLAALAGGADGSRLTLAAKAAVERAGKR